MKLVRLVPIVALLAIAGCGKVAPREPAACPSSTTSAGPCWSPAAGKSLPMKPAMASVTPTAEDLLTPPTYATPERVDELMKRSQPRRADRFDLPPPSGEAPVLPKTQEGNTSDDVGVTHPQ